ncbi:MAG TPA: DMT family transporter [Dehalococcoidia bacterium]|nr:DMT family transporter [Dehalococcoidia bacterium]
MTPRAWGALLGVGLIWGASFLFIRVSLDEVSTLQAVAFRAAGGAFVLGAVVALRPRKPRLTGAIAARLVGLSLVATVAPFLLITWSETRIESGTAAILNALMPIFTLLLAAGLFDDERLTTRALGGAFLGFAGVALLSGGRAGGLDGRALVGEGAVVLATLCYAGGNIMVRSLVRSVEGIVISAGQITISAAVTVVALLLLETPRFHLSWDVWGSLAAMAFLGTGLAYILYYWLIEHAGSFRSSLVTYVIPVVGVALGAVVLDEPVTAATLAGGVLIALGVALATGALEAVVRGLVESRKRGDPAVDPSRDAG